MGYPRRLLTDHETVAVELHPHWWYFAAPALALVVSTGVGIGTLIETDVDTDPRTAAGWVSIGLIAVSAIWVIIRYARWTTTLFVITNFRVIYRSGLIAKGGIEIPVERITTVHFRQSIVGRLVGSGELLVEAGSEMGQQRFTGIRQPDRVQRVIHSQIATGRGLHGVPDMAPVDVAAQLERLEGMLERGTLTPEEFASQKRRLLEY